MSPRPSPLARTAELLRRRLPWIADAFGVIALFGILYALLVIGWAVQ